MNPVWIDSYHDTYIRMFPVMNSVKGRKIFLYVIAAIIHRISLFTPIQKVSFLNKMLIQQPLNYNYHYSVELLKCGSHLFMQYKNISTKHIHSTKPSAFIFFSPELNRRLSHHSVQHSFRIEGCAFHSVPCGFNNLWSHVMTWKMIFLFS